VPPGNFVVEIDETLDDHPPLAGAPTRLGILPGRLQVIDSFQQRLALAGGAHDRLDQTGKADLLHRRPARLERVGEPVRRGRQTQLFGRQATDTLAVHGQLRGTRAGDHGKTLALQLDQRRRGNRLDLGHDVMRLLQLDHRTQGRAIEHIDHMAAVRHLHRRGIGIAIHGDHLDAEALQFDHHFLAQLTRTAEQDASRTRRQWGSDTGHEDSSN
jgi:hypothetical protein